MREAGSWVAQVVVPTDIDLTAVRALAYVLSR